MWQTAVALFVAGVGAVLAALTLEAQDTTRDTTRIWLLAAILFVLASLFGLAAVAQAIRRRQRTGDLIQFADNWTAEIHPQAPFLIAHAGFFLRVGADYEEWRGRVLLYGKELPIVKTRRTPVPGPPRDVIWKDYWIDSGLIPVGAGFITIEMEVTLPERQVSKKERRDVEIQWPASIVPRSQRRGDTIPRS